MILTIAILILIGKTNKYIARHNWKNGRREKRGENIFPTLKGFLTYYRHPSI